MMPMMYLALGLMLGFAIGQAFPDCPQAQTLYPYNYGPSDPTVQQEQNRQLEEQSRRLFFQQEYLRGGDPCDR